MKFISALFSSNQFRVEFFGKKVDLTEFFQENRGTVSQCGNSTNSLSHIFSKNLVKITFLLKKSLKSWFHEIFFIEWEFLIFYTVRACVSYLKFIFVGRLYVNWVWTDFHKEKSLINSYLISDYPPFLVPQDNSRTR